MPVHRQPELVCVARAPRFEGFVVVCDAAQSPSVLYKQAGEEQETPWPHAGNYYPNHESDDDCLVHLLCKQCLYGRDRKSVV